MSGYEIMLSDEEVKSLAWLADHGYWPTEAYDEMELRDGEPSDDQRVWLIPEHAAWSITELAEEDPDAFLACAGPPLLEKLVRLWESIV